MQYVERFHFVDCDAAWTALAALNLYQPLAYQNDDGYQVFAGSVQDVSSRMFETETVFDVNGDIVTLAIPKVGYHLNISTTNPELSRILRTVPGWIDVATPSVKTAGEG